MANLTSNTYWLAGFFSTLWRRSSPIETRTLTDTPRVEVAMKDAGFVMNENGNPGAWVGKHDIQIDLMVAESQGGKKRGARIDQADKSALRTVYGLEGALVDKDIHAIPALEASDDRIFEIFVAGPAALVIAKLVKIEERRHQQVGRLIDKDALDVFRLLQAMQPKDIADRLVRIESDADAKDVAVQAVELLRELFGSRDAVGCEMVVRAANELANQDTIKESLVILTEDLLTAVEKSRVV